jgi:DNA-binding transcriptional LysR family regulator
VNLLRDTSWDALLAFAEFAEDGNFTRAAERLHISQPALHTKISKLADALQAVLYVRHGRNIEITEAGRKVQRFAREMAGAAQEFQGELLGAKGTQPVVLAAGEGSYLYLLGEAIHAHRTASKHPLRLQTADRHAALDAVISARAHLGVASLGTLPADLVVKPLTRVGQMLAIPSRHPLASRRTIRLRDLHGAELIVPPEPRPHRTMLSRMLQSERVEWNVAVEATGWELMLEFVRLGLGMAVVNACCRMPRGVVARPMPELPSLEYFVFHLDKPLSKAAAELKQRLLAFGDSWKKRNA